MTVFADVTCKIYLLVFITSMCNVNVTSGQLLQEFASKLCPKHSFCDMNSSEVLDDHGQVSCCTGCSCRMDCWKTGNCCFDKEKTIAQAPELICESTMVKEGQTLPTIEEANGLIDDIRRYFVKSECPKERSAEGINQACVSEPPKSLEDLIWVSDTTSGEIYKNRYCAECNGIQNWKSWKIRTFCRDILDAKMSNIVDILLKGDCGIVNEAPDDEEERAMNWQCYEPKVTVCNETGLWQQYNPQIEAACQSYNIPYFKGGKLHEPLIIYKNLFCFICNHGDVDNICRAETKPRVPFVPFSALIKYTELPEIKKTTSKCSLEEIFDKYKGVCRNLTCPFGTVNNYGECKPLVQSMSNLGIRLIFHLRVDWTRSSTMANMSMSSEDGDLIIEHFARIARFEKCSLCSTSVLMDTRHPADRPLGNFNIVMEFQTNQNCQLDYVYTSLKNVFDRTINFVTSEKRLTLSVELETRSWQTLDSNRPKLISRKIDGFPRSCFIDLEITRLPCPEIRLLYGEYLDIFVENRNHTLTIRHGELPDEIFICVEDFFKVVRTTASAGELLAVPHLIVLLISGAVIS